MWLIKNTWPTHSFRHRNDWPTPKARLEIPWPTPLLKHRYLVSSVFDKISWYLSLKRRVRKTEHFLFPWTLLVLTQIYHKTRVYWNSQSIWKFLQRQPIPTHYLPEMLRIVLKENFFHFNGKHYLQHHGTAMGMHKDSSFDSFANKSWHILKQQL